MMSGQGVGSYVRRDEELNFGQDARYLHDMARRQQAGAQAKIAHGSRQAAASTPRPPQQPEPQISVKPRQLSVYSTAPLRRSHSIPRQQIHEMLPPEQPDLFDSDVGSDLENTMIIANDQEEEEEEQGEYPDTVFGHDNLPHTVQRREGWEQGTLPFANNGYAPAQLSNSHTQNVGVKPSFNNAGAQQKFGSHGNFPNQMILSGRFQKVDDDEKPPVREYPPQRGFVDEDAAYQQSHQQYHGEQQQNRHRSGQMDIGRVTYITQSLKHPDNEYSDDEISPSPSRSKYRHQNDMSDIPEVSHHNGIPSSDPPDNLEDSQGSGHGPNTPRGNNWVSREAGSLDESRRLKRNLAELDYDGDDLRRMKYSQLKDQPFDDDPKATASVIPESLTGPDILFEERMKHFARENEDLQSKFFEQMNVEDYQQAGDWFMSRFSEIRTTLKDVRDERREITKRFEEELAAREILVRGNIENVDQTLAKMRQGGQGVLNRV